MTTQNTLPAPSLSTMWLQHRGDHVRPWWQQVQALGFTQIELSHIVTPAMIAGLRPGEIPVSSVHFPAPTQPHPHDARLAEVLIGSSDESLRRWAVAQAKGSLDLAAAWGARAVCIHAGRVEMPERLEWVLYQRFYGGYAGTPVYQAALDAFLAARAAAAEPALSQVRRSLHELARHAESVGVRIGVETRLHLYEIPSLAEAELILGEHDPRLLGHWHDAGHVQVQAHLGLPGQAEWLHACGPRAVAAHLHDTRGLRDHLIPGAGVIDFDQIARSLPADALRVCELDWYFSEAEIRAGVRHLAACGLVSWPDAAEKFQ